jgi:hypothetical protein
MLIASSDGQLNQTVTPPAALNPRQTCRNQSMLYRNLFTRASGVICGEGRERAKARGVRLGRPPKLTDRRGLPLAQRPVGRYDDITRSAHADGPIWARTDEGRERAEARGTKMGRSPQALPALGARSRLRDAG